jgi:hypothetical protein
MADIVPRLSWISNPPKEGNRIPQLGEFQKSLNFQEEGRKKGERSGTNWWLSWISHQFRQRQVRNFWQ